EAALPTPGAPVTARCGGRAPACGELQSGARGRAGEPCLEAEDRLRVQLRDAGLGHAEHLADLAQGQLLVVVERDDELLPLREAGDGVGDRLAQLRLRERALGVGRL